MLAAITEGELTVAQKASLEALLLRHWREQLGLSEQRMSVSCRGIEASHELGKVYSHLQAWLHNPRAGVSSGEFVNSYNLLGESSGKDPSV